MSQPPRPHLVGLLAETTAIQAVGTMAVLVVPAIAPKIAETIGVPAGGSGFRSATPKAGNPRFTGLSARSGGGLLPDCYRMPPSIASMASAAPSFDDIRCP